MMAQNISYQHHHDQDQHQHPHPVPPSSDTTESSFSVHTESDHFEIVWSNLSYKIQPKWYKKFNYIDRVFTQFMPGQTVDNHSSGNSTASSSTATNDAADHSQKHYPIEIFTDLNGTIKSGQMTAVLGPSGKCLANKLHLAFRSSFHLFALPFIASLLSQNSNVVLQSAVERIALWMRLF